MNANLAAVLYLVAARVFNTPWIVYLAVLAIAAILLVFMNCPFLIPLCCGVVEKRIRSWPICYLHEFLE